jgi:hypothetical protein
MDDDSTEKAKGWSLEKCKRKYLDFVSTKREELLEARKARRYQHGDQWDAPEIKVLCDRGQAVRTHNQVAKKVNGIVGLIEKLRQDPRAYPRNPDPEQALQPPQPQVPPGQPQLGQPPQMGPMPGQTPPGQPGQSIGQIALGMMGHNGGPAMDGAPPLQSAPPSEGADIATQAIRYVVEATDFRSTSSEGGTHASVGNVGVVELEMIHGDHGDPDVGINPVDPDTFFYDPHSRRPDFSDARYMGVSKWLELDYAKELYPDKAEELTNQQGDELDGDDATRDYDRVWYRSNGKKVRICEFWYLLGDEWHYKHFTSDVELVEGVSEFLDEKDKTFCKYFAFSANIDHDGDRYGFVRNLMPLQDAINQAHSKLQWMLAVNQIIMDEGAVQDVELARKEVSRADGVVVKNRGMDFEIVRHEVELAGYVQILEAAKQEMENFGPNPQLLGEAGSANSGRAIALLQQAGISELGPFILINRAWKLRIYRGVWNTIQRYWTSERWIRVTDNDDLVKFMQINGMAKDSYGQQQLDQYGQPVMVNYLGSLDVDLILDEGPDTINMMADTLDRLQGIPNIPLPILIELMPISYTLKKKLLAMLNQGPSPEQQAAQKLELAGAAAKVDETKSKTQLNISKAHESMEPEMPGQPQQQDYQLPPELQNAQAIADINETNATTEQKRAMAHKAMTDAVLAPAKAEHEASLAEANFHQGIKDRQADRKVSHAPA